MEKILIAEGSGMVSIGRTEILKDTGSDEGSIEIATSFDKNDSYD